MNGKHPGKMLLFLLLALCLYAASACADEAENLTSECVFELSANRAQVNSITDGDYRTYWSSDKQWEPYVKIRSETPVRGLYLCFRTMPDSYRILDGEGSLQERMQRGLDRGFAYYEKTLQDPAELRYYDRIRDLEQFAQVPAENISGSGYVVETLEAVAWALVTTGSFEEGLLKVVNLGLDTDTTGAIAGGLAALYYGYDAIPAAWIEEIQRKEWIGELCSKAEEMIR
jgi:hypothetical protein